MANTTIQIKRSSANAVPTSLSDAELGYSYLSDKLFIGNTSGAVLAIGGKYFVDQQNTISSVASAAFDAANAAGSSTGTNNWTNTVFGYTNTYTQTVGASSNAWANTISVTRSASSNAWTNTVFGYSNTYTQTVGAAANGWANTVGSSANAYADATFLKLTGGTLNGSLNVSGNLIITGNTTFINVATFRVNDPLIYLAGNNYVSDVVDIGFVGNYNVGTSQAHTGLFRDAGSKEYYLFHGYSAEPDNDHIDPAGNNFTISVLNATLRTSNVIIGGMNLEQWVAAAYTRANDAPNIANTFAVSIGASSNAWANTISVTRSASSNAWTNTVFGYSNTYTQTVGAAANGWANTVGSAANSYAATVGSAANTNASDASYLSTGTVPTGRMSGSYTGITGVGTLTSGTWNADVITVPYGGTGVTSFTTNGILYGNNSGALKVTAAGTDGQVLVSNGGVPTFAMLDGGTF